MLILRETDLARLLTAADAIAAMTTLLEEQAVGRVQMPPRLTVDCDAGAGWLRIMPAVLNGSSVMGYKAMNVANGHGARYLVALIDVSDGSLLALMDGDALTALRTAATVALGTRVLAPPRIERMGLLGSGVQARATLEALAAVLEIPEVLVYSPSQRHRKEFAEQMAELLRLPVLGVDSPDQALRGANLVCSAIRAGSEPVIMAEMLCKGVHLSGLSSVRPDAREVEDQVWRLCSRVVVDDLAGVLESGDGAAAADDGFDFGIARELWEVDLHTNLRQDHEEITMFKSVGAATQDLAIARVAYHLARERGVGEEVRDFPSVRSPR